MTDYIDEFVVAGTQPNVGDNRLMVLFTLEPRLDKTATVDAGRNVYKDIEFVTIKIPGDKTLAIHRPVVHSDKMRFPLQYGAFKNARGEQIVGTPLHLWPGVSPARAKELEQFNIRTVEQLASMPDSGSGNMMGIMALKQAAKQYVSYAKEQAPLLAVQRELKERDALLASQAETIKEQGEKLDRILANLASGEASTKKGK